MLNLTVYMLYDHNCIIILLYVIKNHIHMLRLVVPIFLTLKK